jgi:hypothetical protein
MLTGTAVIATSAGASTGYFTELQNSYTGQCLTETGTTTGPWFTGNCVSSNHSLDWEWTGSTYNGYSYGELVNEHSGLCITASASTSTDYGAYYGTCGGNHVQEWYAYTDTCPNNGATTFLEVYKNVHTGYYLADVGGTLEDFPLDALHSHPTEYCWLNGP